MLTNNLLFVDDERKPTTSLWRVAKTYEEAISILAEGEIEVLSLDHDLGEGKSGYDVAKWIVEHNVWPRWINCHSMNPVGKANIRQLLKRYAPDTTEVM